MRGKLNVVISFGFLAAIVIPDCQCQGGANNQNTNDKQGSKYQNTCDKQGSKYQEKFCRDSIDPGDIYSFQREQVDLDDSSLDLMKQAVSLIHGYNNEIWANAEIALFGPKLQIIFWSGERKNKFRISLGKDDHIEIEQITQIQFFAKERCGNLNSCLENVRSKLYRKSLDKVVNEARRLLHEQLDCVLRNARLLLEGPGVNVVLTSGNGKHTLRVVFTEFGDDIESSADVDQRIYESIYGHTIDSHLLVRLSDIFCYSSELEELTRAAIKLLSKESESVWRDAQLELFGLKVHVKIISGHGSTKYQVGRNGDGTVYSRNIEKSWYATFNSISQNFVQKFFQKAKNLVWSIIESLLSLSRRLLT